MLPLLRTKTIIPQSRLKQIDRAGLLTRLAQGMQHALTLLVAPAGFGKTTLASAWARQAGQPVAWLSLQPADRPPERFLVYLIQALQTIAPHIGQTTLALLQSGSQEGALYALLNDLTDVPGDFALVLEDYHTVDGPEVARIVQLLLDHHPASLHLMIISRAAPALSLARLRALGQVAEFSAADLRFSPVEIREFLETCMGLKLTAAELDRLNHSTEGWAVGLQLAGLAFARSPGDWTLPAGQALIFDYLAEEVLRREPPEVQDFLKKTALFDRFCVPLCEAILFQPGGQAGAASRAPQDILAYIERASLFLVSLDAAGTWYRYHALFTDFLRRQLPLDQAPALYEQASRWFEQNGMLEDAIQAAIQAGDSERAARLMEGCYFDMIQRGAQAALLRWIEALPSNLLDQYPRLWLAKGWAGVVSFDVSDSVACVERVERLLSGDLANDRLRGEAKTLRVMARIFAGEAAAMEEISAAFVLLSEQDEFLHSMLHFNLGLNAVMQGNTGQAVEAFTETLRLTSAFHNPMVTIVSQAQLGETRQIRGALGLAERVFQQGIRYAKETLGEHTFLLGMPYISYADLLREQNRFDEALWYGERGISYCQRWQPVASMDGQIALARLEAARGNWDSAFQRLEDAMRVAEASTSVLDDTFVAIHLARLALIHGDRAKAERTINAYELDRDRPGLYYHLWEMTEMVLLRAGVARLADQPAGAADTIARLSTLIAESERRERVTPVIEALILRAYAQHAQAGAAAPRGLHTPAGCPAAESLSRALTLGAQSGYLRIFADEGRPLLRLLEEHHDQVHTPRSYVDQILALLRRESDRTPAQPSPQPAPPPPPPADGLIPLTRRELDILERLAAGKSNQEIAADCTLALTTVKKHVANILAKLEVANRTQAVTVARKRGWVP